MIRRAICPDTDALVSFLYDEFDGSEAADRRAIARHLEECDRCAAEVASLGSVRRTLREWAAPEMSLGFRVVQDSPRRFAWLPAWGVPALPLAAAVLVLGAALGLARFDIQYDANGLRIRTGWGHAATAAEANAGFRSTATMATASPVGVSPVAVRPASQVGALQASASQTGASQTGAVQPASPAAVDAPWRSDLTALERTLRQEFFAATRHAGDRVAATSVVAGDDQPATPAEQAFLRRVQQMIDQSEVRQQQNLALRVAELSRDFDLQRRSDLVRIEQGFGAIANQRAQDVEERRQILNAIRVSQQQP